MRVREKVRRGEGKTSSLPHYEDFPDHFTPLIHDDIIHREVLQNHVNHTRTTKEKFRVLLRRYGDCFVLHMVVLFVCFTQLLVYIHAFQHHHSSLTHSIFAQAFAALNLFLFVHFTIDIVVLFLLSFVLTSNFQGPPAVDRYGDKQNHDNIPKNDNFIEYQQLYGLRRVYHPLNPLKGASAVSRTIRSLPVGPLFDIIWSSASIISGIGVWKTHPLFFFRLMGYAIHHSRLPTSLRMLVGVNKRLFDNGEFLLDMTYITDRVVAMGLPAQGYETLYRNPLEHLATYMRMYHPSRHMVINTCAERVYNKAYFHKLCLFPCKDHEVMPLNRILVFCEIAGDFLSTTKDSVIVVHCMGGKGRTGLMVTSWLLYSKFCQTAEESMRLYATRRTDELMPGKTKTLSNPCQIRFLRYIEEICRTPIPSHFPQLPLPRPLRLLRMVVCIQPTVDSIISMIDNIIIRLTGLFPPTEARYKPFNESRQSDWDYLENQDSYRSRKDRCRSAEFEYLIPSQSNSVSVKSEVPFQILQANDSTFSSLTVGNVVHSEEQRTVAESSHSIRRLDWTLDSGLNSNSVTCMPVNQLIKLVNPSIECVFESGEMQKRKNKNEAVIDSNDDNMRRSSSQLRNFGTSTPIICGEFGIEMSCPKRSICFPKSMRKSNADDDQQEDKELESIGRIWLHSNFLHVGLPPFDLLEEIWRPEKNKEEGKHPKDKIMNGGKKDQKTIIHYQEVEESNYQDRSSFNQNKSKEQCHFNYEKQRRIIVGFCWDDVDFRTKSIRNHFRNSEFLLIAVFDVLE